MKISLKTLLPVILISAIVGGLVALGVTKFYTPSQEERIADFYATETAVLVSPHGLRKKMIKGQNDFVLVDVRSQEEYEREHIVGAVNVPAYRDPDNSAYDDVTRIVNSFRALEKEHPDKDIIVYCYSIPCMTGRKVGHMLAENGVYVKELGVGWNEWRYFWTLWNHEHEWETSKPEEYVVSGSEPGVFELPENGALPEPCRIDNEFGC